MTVGFENVVIVTVVGVSFCLICMCLLGSYCLVIYYSICVNECRAPRDDGWMMDESRGLEDGDAIGRDHSHVFSFSCYTLHGASSPTISTSLSAKQSMKRAGIHSLINLISPNPIHFHHSFRVRRSSTARSFARRARTLRLARPPRVPSTPESRPAPYTTPLTR